MTDFVRTFTSGANEYAYYSLAAAQESGLGDVARLPVVLKVLLENVLRNEDGLAVTRAHAAALASWAQTRRGDVEVPFYPVRVLMPDSSGIPLCADLAAMREAMRALGGDPRKVNPRVQLDVVIDHSLMVDVAGTADAAARNLAKEFERNHERYMFLRWAQQAFDRFRLVPPGNGICHQVNLEALAKVVWTLESAGRTFACPDTVLGMDSHTPMINAMGVLGWGVGGIEAGAAMLGQPTMVPIPPVIGVRLVGALQPGVTTTDLVLTLTQRLRKRGVVGTFLEFCGPALDALTLAERATLANMTVEYGATTGFFPIDAETLAYLRTTGRPEAQIALVEAYAKLQGLWRDATTPEPAFSDVVEFDLSEVETSLAGPRRPQDRVALSAVPASFDDALASLAHGKNGAATEGLQHGAVVIAALTSCTNTSNPLVMVAAGLIARNAVARGLRTKPWVKASLAPGSRLVSDYLEKAGLQGALDTLGFATVGYGCTTCQGNSGPLDETVAKQIEAGDLVVTAVLSGNRNFEGRIHPLVKTNYLASPPLVVAYALAGTVRIDLAREPLGTDAAGQPVYLRDIWPSDREVRDAVAQFITPDMFVARYGDGFSASQEWERLRAVAGDSYVWDAASDYIKRPPFFEGLSRTPPPVGDITGARPLLVLGDSVTTDHISPIGNIGTATAAGRYLSERGVEPADFNNYGSRRVNHDVMIRGTFANIRIRNEMVAGTEGGVTRHMPGGEVMTVHDAAMRYAAEGVPCVVVAGAEYGTGSSRDWAAKGTKLLGVRAVIAESFERIHRSNLVGMGVLPLQFTAGTTRKTLGLDGSEVYDVTGLAGGVTPRMQVQCTATRPDGTRQTFPLDVRIDTAVEVEWYRNGGVLNYVLLSLLEDPT